MSDDEQIFKSMTMDEWLNAENIEDILPNIVGHYKETSKATIDYNCLSWAVELTDTFIDPENRCVGYSWPDGAEREWTTAACRKVLAYYGYVEECDDGSFEDEYVKVAMYVDESGAPTHFARQIVDGNWTSKLGDFIDVVHHNLSCIEGNDHQHYGTAKYYFKKKGPKSTWPPSEEPLKSLTDSPA